MSASMEIIQGDDEDLKRAAPTSNESRNQTVVFLRHGIARHNIVDVTTGKAPNLKDPDLFDPPLILEGKQQALSAGERLRQYTPELVIASPLTRCLQTATLAFLPGDQYTRGNREPKFICVESIREAYGKNYPDRRRNKSELERTWPMFHFDPTMTENDEAWQPHHRESLADVSKRVRIFLDWLVRRNEQDIVVVSHGVYIECMFHALCPEALPNGQRVYNCDAFVADCISQDSKFQALRNVRRI